MSTKLPLVNAVDGNKMASLHKKFPAWAKKRLIDRELSVTQLAQKVGYARQTVSAAVNGSTKFPHVVAAIATHLNHDPKTDGPLPVGPARPERRIRIAP